MNPEDMNDTLLNFRCAYKIGTDLLGKLTSLGLSRLVPQYLPLMMFGMIRRNLREVI